MHMHDSVAQVLCPYTVKSMVHSSVSKGRRRTSTASGTLCFGGRDGTWLRVAASRFQQARVAQSTKQGGDDFFCMHIVLWY